MINLFPGFSLPGFFADHGYAGRPFRQQKQAIKWGRQPCSVVAHQGKREMARRVKQAS